MEKRENLKYFFIILIVISSVLNSCCTTGKQTSVDTNIPPNAVLVTVTDYRDLDGCEFLLTNAEGNKFQPVNLPEKFKKDGLKLYITYKNVNQMSICMAGQMIELLFVEEAKNEKP